MARLPQFFRSAQLVTVASTALVVGAVAGGAGYFAGRQGVPRSADDADFSTFWKAWSILDKKFYGDANAGERVDGAISGMVASLGDPYTMYLEPAANRIFQSDLQGSFGGIGAELIVRDGRLTVQSVLPGTPAEKGGLKALDIITKIGDKEAAKISFNEAIDAIRGEKGTEVKLAVARSGEDATREFTLVRDTIVVKSISTDVIGRGGNVAYIKVNQFGKDTGTAFQQALQEARDAGRSGVVVDLRNNPGGYLDVVTAMVGMVLPEKVESDKQPLKDRIAVIERGKNGKEVTQKAGRVSVLPDLPMVVLVNGGSASASEIFAGAMKDYGRAEVVGTKTFGKGSVQDLAELGNGGSIKVTIAKWFTPLGNGIDGTGVEPDIAIDLPESVVPSLVDEQVTKALEVLTK